MSFEEQERALFDLLFEEAVREAFAADPARALAPYDLSREERAELRAIDPFGLDTDARMRRELILHRLCRAFPISFSIASCLPQGLALAARLVHGDYVRTATPLRTASYGRALRSALAGSAFDDERLRCLCLAVVDAEVALASVSAELRERALSGEYAPEAPPAPLQDDWETRPLSLAPFLCVVVLPRAHGELRRELCPTDSDRLWAWLKERPLPAARLRHVFEHEAPRLLVGRAVLVRASRCETTVTQQLMELSDGFAPLFAQLTGQTTPAMLLGRLERVGASESVREGVRVALRRMLTNGMLRVPS